MRPEDLARAEAVASAPPEVPEGWSGPLPPEPAIWGGPSLEYAQQQLISQVVPNDAVEDYMNYGRAGSGVPESLQGIFWMDQWGNSSVAREAGYGFNMMGLPETLVAFGGAEADGTVFQEGTRCLTPIPFYAGKHLAAWGDSAYGEGNIKFHRRCRTTLSFCFTDDTFQSIEIFQIMLTNETSVGSQFIGSWGAWLLGYPSAGSNYSWTPRNVLHMTMEKRPWGWDRITTAIDPLTHSVQTLLSYLPDGMSLGAHLAGKYPAIQIVDGNGQRTAYYQEYLAAMRSFPRAAENMRLAATVAEV